MLALIARAGLYLIGYHKHFNKQILKKMKKIFVILLSLIFVSNIAFAQNDLGKIDDIGRISLHSGAWKRFGRYA
jgi:hypothetical protein